MRWIILWALTLSISPVWAQTTEGTTSVESTPSKPIEETQQAQPPNAVRNYFGLGAGLESHLDHEVNPDYFQLQNMGHYYGIAGRGIYSVVFEFNRERQRSQSGAMEISTTTTSLSLLGRMELGENGAWKTFASAGVGERTDRVTSVFGASVDKRDGVRKYFGLGWGISGLFWEHVQVEAEGRAIFVQDRKDPQLIALLKVGVQFGSY